ncbi:MAG: 16S rRNA (cytidine(1402)-2'-O)-methyltransferase [Armatimonadota bacterium]|nr:16S rRNA (cytidine(1402)-2'-O)-methyltransferase [Armatimonadota bacterium]MDR7533246.1 16S rRNA (cytidine(1402)-2'-O)-methyltransferase [Armatimonadota bacterium]MDR7536961.1 16S rRNA (cytidine(1402)-2'-O)-methyltransferase [Armatimonadota bacterium]
MSGTLYLVATPIGNLEDLTPRAARVLREVALVACEDTRRTRGLLAHLGVRARVVSLHAHNERARVPELLARLRDGTDVAVVSDAGMPTISDPGAHLVAAAAAAGIPVVAVPGPSAVTAAVALADFPAERFVFAGFLPSRAPERRRALAALAPLPMALVLFEAPHRVRATLRDLAAVLGDRPMLMARELTKVHEEVLRGTAQELLDRLPERIRGEITLVVAGAPTSAGARGPAAASEEAGAATAASGAAPQAMMSPEAFLQRLRAAGLSRRDAGRALAVAYGLPPRAAYRLAARADGEPGGRRRSTADASGEGF